jgi:hypothetical protein
VMRAQVRSTVVDLLMLTGLTYDEARARVPASAALDDRLPAPSTPDHEDADAAARGDQDPGATAHGHQVPGAPALEDEDAPR